MCTITKWLPSDFEEYVLWQAYRPTTTILEIFGGRYLSPRAASPLKILSNLEQTRLLFPLITLPSHLERFQNLQPPAENFSTSAICGSPGQAPSTPITQSVEEFIGSTPSIVFFAVARLCTLSPYGNPAKLYYHFAAKRDVESMRVFHIPVDPMPLSSRMGRPPLYHLICDN